jgi:hypothetical protein
LVTILGRSASAVCRTVARVRVRGWLCCVVVMAYGCASNDPMAGGAAYIESNCIRVCGGTMRPGRTVITNEVRQYCLAVRHHAQSTGQIYDYASDPRCGGVR